MTKQPPTDPIAFVRKVASDPFWQIAYHEEKLTTAHSKLRLAKELVERCGFDLDAERADEDEDGEAICENVTQFALSILDEAEHSVEWHEEGLAQAHRNAAFAKIMLERGNYTEIDIEQIRLEQEQRAKE